MATTCTVTVLFRQPNRLRTKPRRMSIRRICQAATVRVDLVMVQVAQGIHAQRRRLLPQWSMIRSSDGLWQQFQPSQILFDVTTCSRSLTPSAKTVSAGAFSGRQGSAGDSCGEWALALRDFWLAQYSSGRTFVQGRRFWAWKQWPVEHSSLNDDVRQFEFFSAPLQQASQRIRPKESPPGDCHGSSAESWPCKGALRITQIAKPDSARLNHRFGRFLNR